ncbi:MAG: CDP-glycerol glycerophosphotransferase family protein [Gammaproteobacteria bacterium]|nr:CDP-glycerol glycerophosphotransferase family protein [Gammaproteobacteria bacterium]
MNHPTETRRLLFYVEQDYSFDILRPLQAAARRRGYEVRWLVVSNASASLLAPDELQCSSISDARHYNPAVVFAPGNRTPGFIPGLKVQVFHGISENKRGMPLRERGLFDLYCTTGPLRTRTLKDLNRDYLYVAETGWIKLDALFGSAPITRYERPQILFASTFTPNLSGAEPLYDEIKRLSRSGEWQWLITLHPKMAAQTVDKYRQLENENLSFFGTEHVIELLHRADVMVSDNSSILQEFMLLTKPVITYRNRAPEPCMLDIREPDQLEPALRKALDPEPALLAGIEKYATSITPWRDAGNSDRVLDAVEQLLDGDWHNRKPLNLWRNIKMRIQLGYFGL